MILHDIDELPADIPFVATLGVFDGLHAGPAADAHVGHVTERTRFSGLAHAVAGVGGGEAALLQQRHEAGHAGVKAVGHSAPPTAASTRATPGSSTPYVARRSARARYRLSA